MLCSFHFGVFLLMWTVSNQSCCSSQFFASFSVSAQAPNSAITAPTGVGVASTVHLNPMQLMTVDASHARHIQGIQPAPISTQGIQPAPIGTPGIQPAPIGTQSIHSATPLSTQGLQPAAVGTQQPPPEGKTSGNCHVGRELWCGEKRDPGFQF